MVFGENFRIAGLRRMGFFERAAEWAAGVLRADPAFFAVCCCGPRDCYIGRARPERVSPDLLGCRRCAKFAHGCWGPRVEAR